MLTALLLLQAASLPTAPAETEADRCVALMRTDPAVVAIEAARWEREGGGATARQCLGLAHAARRDWPAAGTVFEELAGNAPADSDRAATYWAQAGNAWLAAGDAARAAPMLARALTGPTLVGLERGEAELDHGRALALTGDRAGARGAIDRALLLAADDPLAWLLSATLARQAGELARARTDIAQALTRAADDPAVQLEAGNIAASAGDEPGARTAWGEVVRLRPGSAEATAAARALAQFD